MNFSRILKCFTALALAAAFSLSCVREDFPDKRDGGYGYVQFKLYKEASYSQVRSSLE